MGKLISKAKALSIVLILGIIVIAEVILEEVLPEFPTWPAMVAMIFFFVVHQDSKMAPHILIGGAFGILNLPLILQWYHLVGSNSFTAKLIYILIFVALIIILMDVLHVMFNSFAFMYFLIASLAAGTKQVEHLGGLNAAIIKWIAIELIGGGLIILALIGGRMAIGKILGGSHADPPQNH